jgi:hypothetical protein
LDAPRNRSRCNPCADDPWEMIKKKQVTRIFIVWIFADRYLLAKIVPAGNRRNGRVVKSEE